MPRFFRVNTARLASYHLTPTWFASIVFVVVAFYIVLLHFSHFYDLLPSFTVCYRAHTLSRENFHHVPVWKRKDNSSYTTCYERHSHEVLYHYAVHLHQHTGVALVWRTRSRIFLEGFFLFSCPAHQLNRNKFIQNIII